MPHLQKPLPEDTPQWWDRLTPEDAETLEYYWHTLHAAADKTWNASLEQEGLSENTQDPLEATQHPREADALQNTLNTIATNLHSLSQPTREIIYDQRPIVNATLGATRHLGAASVRVSVACWASRRLYRMNNSLLGSTNLPVAPSSLLESDEYLILDANGKTLHRGYVPPEPLGDIPEGLDMYNELRAGGVEAEQALTTCVAALIPNRPWPAWMENLPTWAALQLKNQVSDLEKLLESEQRVELALRSLIPDATGPDAAVRITEVERRIRDFQLSENTTRREIAALLLGPDPDSVSMEELKRVVTEAEDKAPMLELTVHPRLWAQILLENPSGMLGHAEAQYALDYASDQVSIGEWAALDMETTYIGPPSLDQIVEGQALYAKTRKDQTLPSVALQLVLDNQELTTRQTRKPKTRQQTQVKHTQNLADAAKTPTTRQKRKRPGQWAEAGNCKHGK